VCQDCDATKWRGVIQEILDTGVSQSDENFLTDVDSWIETNGHVTEPQIEKIKEKADEANVDY
jgi:hypothetical protein